jgi:hypothetical protein
LLLPALLDRRWPTMRTVGVAAALAIRLVWLRIGECAGRRHWRSSVGGARRLNAAPLQTVASLPVRVPARSIIKSRDC